MEGETESEKTDAIPADITTALARANRMVQWPSMAVLFFPLVAYLVLANRMHFPSQDIAGLEWAAPFLITSFVGGWLVWSLRVPRWRLWAYGNVRDVELLEAIAMARMIIWPPGSIFERTEIMSRETRAEIDRLRQASIQECAACRDDADTDDRNRRTQ